MSQKQLNAKELLLWNASNLITNCMEAGLRNDLIDFLPVQVRQELLSGYVLQEHYDNVVKQLDITRMSGNILKEIVSG